MADFNLDTQFYTIVRHAYQESSRGKKSKPTIDQFRMYEEQNIMQLYEKLKNNDFSPWKATFFIIHDPVQREICAAPFQDRIVHHIIYRYLQPIFDNRFIADSYWARIWKWTHYWVKKTLHHIRQCSQNNQTPCRIMKIDIQWFFMNIDKKILAEILHKTLTTYNHKHYHEKTMPLHLRKRIQQIIFYDPTKDFTIRGAQKDWIWLAHTKSLFKVKPWRWLPLGNLTSQLFANIYLNELDQYIKHVLKIRYYWRYMDDMVLIHTDKKVLLEAKQAIWQFVWEKLHLQIHPKKHYLQPAQKWVPFLWYHIYPRWFVLGKRTRKSRRCKIRARNHEKVNDPTTILQSYNSYLGIASHGKNYNLRKKYIKKLSNPAANKIYASNNYKKLSPYTKKVPKKHQ